MLLYETGYAQKQMGASLKKITNFPDLRNAVGFIHLDSICITISEALLKLLVKARNNGN